MKPFTLHRGDCIEVMRTMADNSVDAIVCDPPYGLSKEPDMAEVLRHWLAGDDYQHKGGGFMGKSWDSFVPGPSVWREAMRVLKPGGHLLAFFGSRTYDIGTLAIRLAGFEVRDQTMWLYGSGFPKSLDVSKAIDKSAGAERDVIGSKIGLPGYSSKATESNNVYGEGFGNAAGAKVSDITAPATDAARQWEGWGTALKPAHEPICVARKPLVGTVAANVLQFGTGAINIDGCRVGTSKDVPASVSRAAAGNSLSGSADGSLRHETGAESGHDPNVGRWPANIIHDGSAEVVAVFPSAGGGDRRGQCDGRRAGGFGDVGAPAGDGRPNAAVYADAGSAARFFYCAKASRSDRNEGTDTLPQKVGGMVSNTSGQHITRRDEGYEAKPQGNHHPTVKPTDLMAYLCRLVTPPGGLVLDPFMGSGSTGKAAMREGFRFVGIELDEAYLSIARARIDHEHARVEAAKAPSPVVPPAPQLDLFATLTSEGSANAA